MTRKIDIRTKQYNLQGKDEAGLGLVIAQTMSSIDYLRLGNDEVREEKRRVKCWNGWPLFHETIGSRHLKVKTSLRNCVAKNQHTGEKDETVMNKFNNKHACR